MCPRCRNLSDLCCDLSATLERTASLLETESPALAECGYWSAREKDAFDRGRELLASRDDYVPLPLREIVDDDLPPSLRLSTPALMCYAIGFVAGAAARLLANALGSLCAGFRAGADRFGR